MGTHARKAVFSFYQEDQISILPSVIYNIYYNILRFMVKCNQGQIVEIKKQVECASQQREN